MYARYAQSIAVHHGPGIRMPIQLRRISDQKSFESATAAPRDTAALYFYKQLDPFYDVVYQISLDIMARPQVYTGLGSRDAVAKLAALRARLGVDERLPSPEQRSLTYAPIFGAPGMSENFDKLRDDLLAAATAFAERVFDTGVDMLRERVRTAHRPLKDYLLGLTGDSTDFSARTALSNLAESIVFAVIRFAGICSVFGVGTPPAASWPYSEDSNADKLMEEITSRITPGSILTRQQASNRQRLAARGAEAIAAVIEYAENSEDRNDDIASLNVLITQCYTWAAAKKALTG
jgi:hypothetical protein